MANTDINRNPEDLADFVRERLELSLSECEENGYPVRLFEGKRTNERQAWLWTQGRTRPGKIITNAGVNQSYHIWGLATDCVFWDGKSWDWSGPFDKIIPIFKGHGFKSLYPFESCHFEISSGLSVKQCAKIVKDYSLEYLWDEITSRLK